MRPVAREPTRCLLFRVTRFLKQFWWCTAWLVVGFSDSDRGDRSNTNATPQAFWFLLDGVETELPLTREHLVEILLSEGDWLGLLPPAAKGLACRVGLLIRMIAKLFLTFKNLSKY